MVVNSKSNHCYVMLILQYENVSKSLKIQRKSWGGTPQRDKPPDIFGRLRPTPSRPEHAVTVAPAATD